MLQPNYEPYSSVSFQQKQRTSPYPTNSNSSHPYPLLKSYDLGHPSSSSSTSLSFLSWRRKRVLSKRTLWMVGLTITLLIFLFRQWILLYWAFFRIKLDSSLFDRGYIPCGVIRKEPMLYVQDSQHLQVVWEMNCNMKNMVISWRPSISSQSWASTSVEPTILDDRHVLYKTVLGPLNNMNTTEYHYRIETDKARRIRQYTVTWKYHLQSTTTTSSSSSLSTTKKTGGRDDRIRIAAMADNQFGLTTFLRILRQLQKHKPDYLLHAGDAVQSYPSLKQWQTDFVAPLTYFNLGQQHPMIYAHGNHDHDPTYEYHYTRSSTTTSGDPWHAFSLADGAIRFIVLDSNLDWRQQDEWLQRELASQQCRKAAFRIVVVHIPPFLEYWDPEAWFNQKQSEWGAFVRQRFVPLFEKYGVDMVISGHQHNYERGQRNQIHYAIIGGAGGDLDFDRVHDWGMYESNLLDFHFVILDLIPQQQDSTWQLVWHTYDIDGILVDKQVITSSAIKPLALDNESNYGNQKSNNNHNDDNDKDDDEDDDRGAVDGDIIQDITLMGMDDQEQ